MKKLIIASVVLILGWTAISHAQSRINPDQAKRLKENFQQFKSKLNLSDTQSVQVRAIDSVYLTKLSGLRNQGGSRLSKLREFKKLSATKDKQMKKVLSKAQYNAYLEIKAQSREKFKTNHTRNQTNSNL